MTTIQSILYRLTEAVSGTDKRTCRRCSVCGKLMREGYCVDMGAAYYCSDECLHTEYSDEEWAEECENNDQSYYTEW